MKRGNSKADLAAESAFSLPLMPVWLGTIQKTMSFLAIFKTTHFRITIPIRGCSHDVKLGHESESVKTMYLDMKRGTHRVLSVDVAVLVGEVFTHADVAVLGSVVQARPAVLQQTRETSTTATHHTLVTISLFSYSVTHHTLVTISLFSYSVTHHTLVTISLFSYSVTHHTLVTISLFSYSVTHHTLVTISLFSYSVTHSTQFC